MKLLSAEGINPCEMKGAALKKAAAKVGVSAVAVGTQDEILSE